MKMMCAVIVRSSILMQILVWALGGCRDVNREYSIPIKIEIYSLNIMDSIERIFDTQSVMSYSGTEHVEVSDPNFMRSFADKINTYDWDTIPERFYGHPVIVCIVHKQAIDTVSIGQFYMTLNDRTWRSTDTAMLDLISTKLSDKHRKSIQYYLSILRENPH